jgi:hypothetical protein
MTRRRRRRPRYLWSADESRGLAWVAYGHARASDRHQPRALAAPLRRWTVSVDTVRGLWWEARN